MIQHIMLWNYREGVSEEERVRLESELAELSGKVPALREVRWGPVVGGRNQSFSHCFVMLFDDIEGLQQYATHPDHLHFSGPFKDACEVQVVIDFEERGD
jgi:hypothetical protein